MPCSVLKIELLPFCFAKFGLANTEHEEKAAGQIVLAPEAVQMFPEHLEGSLDFLWREVAVAAVFNAASIPDGECCGWIVQP